MIRPTDPVGAAASFRRDAAHRADPGDAAGRAMIRGLTRRMPLLFAMLPSALVLLAAMGAHAGVRSLVAVAFLLICPGLPWVWTLGTPTSPVRIMLAVAASVAIDVLVSEAMILSRWWHPWLGFGLLTAIGGCGLLLGWRRQAWRP